MISEEIPSYSPRSEYLISLGIALPLYYFLIYRSIKNEILNCNLTTTNNELPNKLL